MTVRRIMPDFQVDSEESMKASSDFYGLLGFREVMAVFSGGSPQTPAGWVVTLASPTNPAVTRSGAYSASSYGIRAGGS